VDDVIDAFNRFVKSVARHDVLDYGPFDVVFGFCMVGDPFVCLALRSRGTANSVSLMGNPQGSHNERETALGRSDFTDALNELECDG
jgi:hypothetical protein